MTDTSPVVAENAAPLRRSRRRRLLWLVLLCVGLVLLSFASVAIGSRSVSWSEIVAGLSGAQATIGEAAVTARIPRTVLALLVGGALGVAGVVMQGVTRNPIADPGILGVTMGASLAVVVTIVWFGISTASGYIWTAIIGAAVAAVFVYLVGSLGRSGPTPLKLALAGAATSAALSAFLIAVSLPRADLSGLIRSWQIGGVGGATFASIQVVAPFLAVGFVVCLLCARSLNTLALGDELAAGLGEKVATARLVSAAGAVVLCGAATAVAGPIAFVGLVVAHGVRLLVGVDHRWLLPFSALAGAALVLASDILGRVIARPDEIDVGIITALVGAPFFIALVRRQRMREL